MEAALPISPFTTDDGPETTDRQLVTAALEEAEDVTQEVLVKVITKLASYDPQRAAFRT